MLEQTRRQASIFVYLIFGLLILIFIWGINPGNRGDRGSGCSTTSNTVISVDGTDANNTAFLIAYSANGASGRQKVYLALDSLVRRELLAQAAAERGIRTTGELVDEEIKRGAFFLGGQRIDFTRQFFDEVDGEKFFNIKRFKGWVGSLNVTPGSYREEQERGMQASMMAELLTNSVRVSRDEALANYLYENNTVTYDVVAIDPGKYRLAMRLGDADIKRFLEGHAAEVEARFKADERTYKGVKPQLALREIFIPKAAPAAAKPVDDPAAKPDAKPDDDKATKPADDKAARPADDKKSADKAKPGDKKADKVAAKPADKSATKPADDKAAKPADKKPAVGEPANPRGLPPEAAKPKLDAAREAIAAGKLKFTDAEKQLAADSSDDAPADNGDRGWRSVDNAGLGDKAVNDAVKALKPGEMTPVIVTDRGAYLVMATDRREGDLNFDQVKAEIAATLAKDVWSKEAAKRAALEALATAQGGKPLDQLFERELVKPSNGGIEELLNDPNMTPEQKQQIIQQLMQQQKHGSLEVHEQDVPVAWLADDDGSAAGGAAGGSSPAGASAGSGAAPAAAATGSAAPAGAASGAAPGSASPGAGSGSAAAPATPPPPPAPTVVEASKDVLPAFGEVPKAKVNRLGPSPRQPKMPGIGGAKEAVDALFDDLEPGHVAKHVYEGDGGNFVVVQLINRAQPKVEEFDKTADAEITRMQEARGKAALGQWLKERCEALSKAGKIRPAPDRIRETDDKGNPAPTVYHPCMYLDYLDR